MISTSSGSSCNNAPVLTACPIPISELAILIKEIIGYKGELIFDKSMPEGKKRKLIDSSEIFSLGWKPKISLEDGIKNTYKWYLNNLSSTL